MPESTPKPAGPQVPGQPPEPLVSRVAALRAALERQRQQVAFRRREAEYNAATLEQLPHAALPPGPARMALLRLALACADVQVYPLSDGTYRIYCPPLSPVQGSLWTPQEWLAAIGADDKGGLCG